MLDQIEHALYIERSARTAFNIFTKFIPITEEEMLRWMDHGIPPIPKTAPSTMEFETFLLGYAAAHDDIVQGRLKTKDFRDGSE